MRRTKLIEARKAVGKSQADVAKDVGTHRTTIASWETGGSTPHPKQRPAYAESIQVTLGELHAILSSLPLTDEMPAWLHHYLGMEQSATRIVAHEPYVVYGLLQTLDYAGAIADSVGTTPPGEEYIERTKQLRAVRQQRVQSGDLAIVALQPEFALRLRIGDNAMMAAQMRHLADVCERDNVTVQVVPYDAGQYEALRIGIFALMTHPWRPAPSVHLEGYGGARWIDEGDEVAYFADAVEQAERRALSPEASQEFIVELAGEWNAA